MAKIEVTYFNDPGCPWGYSANPALSTLRWRYRDQLAWRMVMIGLTEDAARYVELGYTTTRMAVGNLAFRRYGMPFAPEPRPRVAATGRACRAIVATRLQAPERENAAFRALEFAWFTSTLVMDDDNDLLTALSVVPDLDAAAVVNAIESPEVEAAYQSDREEARSAAGGATEFQGKAANSDGRVRYTAPSLLLNADGRTLEAGGFQTIEAYDVLIANLDRSLERHPAPESPAQALEVFPDGLTTQEVAAIMAQGNNAPDRVAAERALIELAGEGRARRVALGDDALWLAR